MSHWAKNLIRGRNKWGLVHRDKLILDKFIQRQLAVHDIDRWSGDMLVIKKCYMSPRCQGLVRYSTRICRYCTAVHGQTFSWLTLLQLSWDCVEGNKCKYLRQEEMETPPPSPGFETSYGVINQNKELISGFAIWLSLVTRRSMSLRCPVILFFPWNLNDLTYNTI